jgi:gas vesicle protein
MTDMNAHTQESRHYGFAIGLLTGAAAGAAGLMMWLAPRTASELRQRMTDSVKSLGRQASRQYQQAGHRIGEAVAELTRKGQDVRDGASEAVARGAHEVRQYVTAANPDRTAQPRRRPATDRSASTPHSQ